MERQSFLVRIFWQPVDSGPPVFRAEVVHIASGTRTICTDGASLLACLLNWTGGEWSPPAETGGLQP